jgi:hypothetical protein
VLQFVYTRHFFMGIFCGYLIATAIFRFELNLELKDLNTGESRKSNILKIFIRNSPLSRSATKICEEPHCSEVGTGDQKRQNFVLGRHHTFEHIESRSCKKHVGSKMR